MRNSGSPHVRWFVAFVAVWLSVCDLAFAQTAKPQTAKEQFEAAQQRDEQLRIVLTNFTNAAPAAGSRQAGQPGA